ncbi:MAG TPA: ferritin-like domain-containing protein [Kofleriaceae bacterium]|nr:ferritin-like domain-containing protein [Kofleriaceae bacterium]
MIARTTDRLLARFAVELAATSPRPVPARPDLSAFDEPAREAARYAWASRIVDEYRSVAVFSELLGLLTDLAAPIDALCAVQRLIGDELRHTELTAEIVDWLGGAYAVDLRDVALPPRGADETRAGRAQRIVARELVVGEEESLHVLAAYRDATTEPAIRDVLGIVLVDEVRHAATGRALLALFTDGPLADEPGLLDGPALDRLMRDDRAALRADYLRAARPGPGRALGACVDVTDLERAWQRSRSTKLAAA